MPKYGSWNAFPIPSPLLPNRMSVCDLIGHDVGQYYRKQKSCKFGCYTPSLPIQ